MNFNEELKQRVEQINALLAAKLPAEEGMQQRVAEAMNYSVNAGGKRLIYRQWTMTITAAAN